MHYLKIEAMIGICISVNSAAAGRKVTLAVYIATAKRAWQDLVVILV